MLKKLFLVVSLLITFSMVLAACAPATTVVTEVVQGPTQVVKETQVVEQTSVVKETQIVEVTATPAPSTRTGAWVDQLVFTEQNEANAAVKQLQANDMDVYAYSVSDAQLFEEVKADPKLSYTTAFGSYTELTFNPWEGTFDDGRLNPFGDPKVREAMNWLVDRNYIVQEIYGGLAKPKVTSLNSAFPDYTRYIDTVRALEVQYAYNPDQAKTVITSEMEAMGATMGSDGKWQFNGAPVTIIAIIRTEDERREIGDYVCNQLETIGFMTDRQYKTRSEASPIWNQGEPKLGLMHFYTGGWITTSISRDDATNFGFFYTPLGGATPLWQGYKNDPAFYKGDGTGVAEKLWVNDFKTMDERQQLFDEALVLAQKDSVRVWLVDQTPFSPQIKNLSVAYDLAGGVAGSALYALTIRFTDHEGGVMRIGQPGVLVEPWNPVAGTNWVYDSTPQQATTGGALIADPYTGLYLPLRLEKADVVVQEGLPVAQTLDWFTLSTAPSIEVPADAWVDWDATNQKWITASEKYTSTLTALTKTTVTYPADMFTTVKYHDGSFMSVGDFVMNMIMTFDLGKPDSPNYDEAIAPTVDAYLSHFKGIVIESTDPLVITTYDDRFFLDAEWIVYYNATWWPVPVTGYGRADPPWEAFALGNMADAGVDPEIGQLAWSTDKATKNNVEWLSFIAGPSLDILKGYLDKAKAENYIPFAPTMSQFVTTDEATLRWSNFSDWYDLKGHFWDGTGPFYLEKAYPTEKTVSLLRFPDYPDLSSRWSIFGAPMIPVVEVDGPGEVSIGAEATYDVFITFNDAPYPSDKIDAVKYLVFDASGAVIFQGDATAAEEGHYTVAFSADESSKLVAGSNKLEVVTTSKAVSIPGITDFEFVAK
jgi:peptide/nickel transport system substrate-binding protein